MTTLKRPAQRIDPFSSDALAGELQLQHHGERVTLCGVSEPAEAQPTDLALCLTRDHLTATLSSRAGATLCSQALASSLIDVGWGGARGPLLIAPERREPRALLGELLRWISARVIGSIAEVGRHPSALIDPSAVVDPSAYIGPFVVIEADVIVEAGARVEAYVFLGQGARVRANAHLQVRASLLAGCEVGERVTVGPGAVLGGQGFGLDERGLLPHLGRVEIEADASVGALSCVDRATLGVTRIQAGAQLDNLVQVAHNAQVGQGSVLCAQVGLAGGARLEERVTLAGQVGVNNRVTIGAGAVVAAQSGVTRNLEAGGRYSGHPAEPNMPRLRRTLKLRRLLEGRERRSETRSIHPSAWIHPSAELAEGVEVHEGAWIGEGVQLKRGAVLGAWSRLEAGCRLDPYAVVGERSHLAEGCQVSSFAVVGAHPQLKERSLGAPINAPRYELICGANSLFREGCTVSRGAPELGEGVTRIGEGCLLMAYSHVGHDAQVGPGCVLANQVSIAGHVIVGERVSFGGHAAVHQFVQIGALAFVAANAMVSSDVPPYCLVAGDHATLRGLNHVGLKRAGVSSEARAQLKLAYHERLRGHAVAGGLTQLSAERYSPELRALLDFLTHAKRGVCRVAR